MIQNCYLRFLIRHHWRQKVDDKELFVDENWKINSQNMRNIIPSDTSNLKRILSDIFPNKKIMIQDNNDGSQTIFLS